LTTFSTYHAPVQGRNKHKERTMLKVLGWAVLIIFLIGLLVVFGIIDLIF